MLQQVADMKAQRDMFERQYQALYNEATKNGTVSGKTGDLVMPTGEVMTPELFMERSRMFNENKQTLERRVKELEEARRGVGELNAKMFDKSKRVQELEDKLNWFERPREIVFTSQMHEDTLGENAKLKAEQEVLSREMAILKSRVEKYRIGALDKPTVVIPATCPMGGCEPAMYARMVLANMDPVKALKNHMRNIHFCVHCKSNLKDTTVQTHAGLCTVNKLKVRVPKRPRVAYVQDDAEAGTEEEQIGIRNELAIDDDKIATFVIPVTKEGVVDLKVPYHGKFCRFCHEGPFVSKDARADHEDYCAPVETYPGFKCPCFMFSDDARMNVCSFWAVEERRAWAHARRENRRRVIDTNYSMELCPMNEKRVPAGRVLLESGHH